ncbi:hypothetical protein [Thiothrix lacustris]|jgi:hypothetical protein|uniref:Uncharacterized protein n=1 Tax=Thiothrix lacustris TaxID=525917 RepID=A0ABY9MUB4_9GAMM|nr:hypothetical protein [Thiothrix lacustris]WML92032.1 hypothetical protein RCF98_06735 [Thiothrix lacustris]WMP16150.1 hypothetical protein RCS87_12205 [Thiothrix lacustris]
MFGKRSPKPAPTPDFMQDITPVSLKTAAARRFLAFCQQDFPTYQKADGFDPNVYKDAVKLVISRLEATRHME